MAGKPAISRDDVRAHGSLTRRKAGRWRSLFRSIFSIRGALIRIDLSSLGIHMSKKKTFTLEEAQTLLPVLRSLLQRSIDGKKLIEQAEKEFQDLNHRILLSGGLFVDAAKVARRRAEREKAIQDTKDALAEIEAIGVQVKDLDIGLLDFPCIVEEQTVLLCWKLGEESIQYWHGLEEGFRGRKPIDERISKGKQREKPN
jgi:hypothetical protein